MALVKDSSYWDVSIIGAMKDGGGESGFGDGSLLLG